MFSTLKSVKEAKIRIGATRRNLQAQPKMLKKNCRSTKSTHQNENFPKKTMFSTLKLQKSQKFVWELPDRISGRTSKS
jgi:hypothetical protein